MGSSRKGIGMTIGKGHSSTNRGIRISNLKRKIEINLKKVEELTKEIFRSRVIQ